MTSEEKSDIEKIDGNQKNFAKKRKITIICLSALVVFTTLIAGFFLVKKNKESSYENDDIEEVDSNDNDNGGVIINEDDYFFNKTSGQITENILLVIVNGLLFFLLENIRSRKKKKNVEMVVGPNKNGLLEERKKVAANKNINNSINDNDSNDDSDDGEGFMNRLGSAIVGNNKIHGFKEDKKNWLGLLSLIFFIMSTIFTEFVVNHLLIGSAAHFFSKDKNKRYLHTLKMSVKKRIQSFFSYSKIMILLVILVYLLFGFVIAIAARMVSKICCRREIIESYKVEDVSPDLKAEELENLNNITN